MSAGGRGYLSILAQYGFTTTFTPRLHFTIHSLKHILDLHRAVIYSIEKETFHSVRDL